MRVCVGGGALAASRQATPPLPRRYVTASPDRFTSVCGAPSGAAGIAVEVRGAPGEAVTLAFVRPAGTLGVATCTVQSDGLGSLVLV